MTRKTSKKIIVITRTILLSIVLHSCAMFNFVGGKNTLKSYNMCTSYQNLAAVANVFIDSAKYISRENIKYSYDKTRHGYLLIKNNGIDVIVHLHYTEDIFNDKCNSINSKITILYISINGLSINKNNKLSSKEKKLLQDGLRIIEDNLVNPLRQQI